MSTLTPTKSVQTLDGKALLNEQEAARLLSVSPRTLRRHTESHGIESVKLGKCRRWRVDDLLALARPAR